jgi:hypothetical protein
MLCKPEFCNENIGGEPAVIDAATRVLESNGHESRLVMKSSRDLEHSIIKRFGAFWIGAYNGATYREMQRLLESVVPTLSMFLVSDVFTFNTACLSSSRCSCSDDCAHE